MFERIGRLFIGFALIFLFIAAIYLMIGHDPNSFVVNMEAETLANYAYSSLVIGLVFLILNRLVRKK